VKQESFSDDSEEVGFCPVERSIDQPEMNAEMVQAIVANAVAAQEECLRSAFASELEPVRTQVSVQAPQVQVYQRAVPNPEVT